MGLNRRKMLGVAVGGGIAGPGIVKDAMAQSGNLLQGLHPPSTPAPYYGDASTKQAAGLDLDALARMKRQAAGVFYDGDRDYPQMGPAEPYDALKSVSSAARRFMLNEYYDRKWRERTMKRALDVLNEYDKTGILRAFF